jgi:NAD(P)H-flavin reductase
MISEKELDEIIKNGGHNIDRFKFATGFRSAEKIYLDKITALEEKLKSSLQLLRELDADFDTQEHSYVGRDSDFHKRIKSILKEQ